MKRLFISTVLLLLAITAFSQTIVSTSPENKNVILEEFTGIHCVFCPDGHAIAQSIMDANPDDVFVINIHTGGFAVPSGSEPDFRTAFGTAIANQSNLSGYPAGTVNRHFFPGSTQNGGTAQSRGTWNTTSNQTMGEASYVNVAVEAELDVVTKELTVHVEAYYTGNSPESTNLLNVALLQDNTLGPQTGGNAGNNYNHMHRLVHLLTGQWGEVISTTTTGTFVDETFTYTIPADYIGVPTEIVDMKVVAFITETHQEIPSGSGCWPVLTNLLYADDAGIDSITEIDDQCTSGDISPQIEVTNYGQNIINSLDFEYSINGGSVETYTWTGTIEPLRHETIDLPAIAFDVMPTNTVNVALTNADENSANDTIDTSFDQAPAAVSHQFNIEIQTDSNGSQFFWNVRDSSDTLMEYGGNYANNTTINLSFDLPVADCYYLTIVDTGNNGGCSFEMTDEDSNVLYYTDGSHGSGLVQYFSPPLGIGVDELAFSNSFIYPNPATSELTVENAEGSNLAIFDLLGRMLVFEENISISEKVNIATLSEGTYIVELSNGKKSKTDKIIISR